MVDSENLCRRAMEIYGFPAQAAMVVEECSELTNAICKFRRGRVGEDMRSVAILMPSILQKM